MKKRRFRVQYFSTLEGPYGEIVKTEEVFEIVNFLDFVSNRNPFSYQILVLG